MICMKPSEYMEALAKAKGTIGVSSVGTSELDSKVVGVTDEII